MKRRICFFAAIAVTLVFLCVICGIVFLKINGKESSNPPGESAAAPQDDCFSDYSGEEIQRVVSGDGNVYSPARCNDIIFYRAGQGEALDTVIAEMKKAILEPLTTDTQDRPFTVTAYNVDGQIQRYCLAPVQDLPEGLDVPQWIREYEWSAVAEEVWLLPVLEGYYCFEGTDMVSMEILLEEGNSKEGMVPFVTQGSGEAFLFILMRQGDVYRLERAERLEGRLLSDSAG